MENFTRLKDNCSIGSPRVIVGDANFRELPEYSNLLIDIQRKYLPLDQSISIESSVTNYDGDSVGHLIQNSEIYSFIVSYYGTILGTFNDYRVQCQNEALRQCTITLNLVSSTG